MRGLVFDVAPMDKNAAGQFVGSIWVEDKDDRIVRFNGTYTAGKTPSSHFGLRSSNAQLYFHFDSWRLNVAPGQWVPAWFGLQPGLQSILPELPVGAASLIGAVLEFQGTAIGINLMFLTLLLLLTSFGVALGSLFLTSDLDLLMSAPIDTRAVFLSKLLDGMAPSADFVSHIAHVRTDIAIRGIQYLKHFIPDRRFFGTVMPF